jgi:signal transduction histidine kinase/CheY-like chemotaxis protein
MHFFESNTTEMKLVKFLKSPSIQWSENRLFSVIGAGFLLLWALSMAVIWARWASESDGIENEMRKDVTVALHAKASEVEGILLRTYHTIRTISMLSGVRGASAKNRESVEENAQELGWIGKNEFDTVRQLYNQIASSVLVSEIYVVQDGFRPDLGQVPFMMFDEQTAKDSHGVNLPVRDDIEHDRPIEDESEEYIDFVRQLELLRGSAPILPANAPEGILPINSRELRTCDNSQYTSIAHGDVREANGFSLSVPVYSINGGHFSGIVTAILRRNIFEATLRGISVEQVLEQPSGQAPDGMRRTHFVDSANYVLEQQSSTMRIFDRNNPYLKKLKGNIGEVFFKDSVDLNLPGGSDWKLHLYVSEERRLEGLSAGRWVAISQATLLTLALSIAWLFVHVLLRQQMAARRQAESQTAGLIDDLTQQTKIANAASLAKSQFLANMSHELRTPMNAILGMLTLLQKTELSARQYDYATKSEGAARALLGLLNELLDFSKIEAGKMVLDPHPFSRDSMLRDLSVILSANIGEKPIALIFDIDPLVPAQLIGDAMRLHQVLLNLGSNATKFTERGEVVLAIKVVQRSKDAATLRFSIKDSGMGIAAADQTRIFSGFSQAEASTTRRFGGTGLGLPISQRFVSLMGGELKLESEPNQGSLFYFTITLPIAGERVDAVADARVDNEQAQASKPVGSAVQRRLEGMRLLLVEDNPNNQLVASELLNFEGALVQIANNGSEGVEAVAAAVPRFDVVLMDLQMPVMDGFDATRVIRFELGLKDLPIVAMTANAMASDREACLGAGMNDHVGKPFDLNHLVRVLRQQAKWESAPMQTQANQTALSQALMQAASDAGIDLAQALRRMGDKQDVYRRTLQTFIKDLEILPEQMQAANPESLRRLIHTLKGLAATLGVAALSSEAAVAEKILASSQTPEQVGRATHAVCAAVVRAAPGLQAVFNALQDQQGGETVPHGGRSSSEIDREVLVSKLQALSRLLQIQDMEAMTAMADLQRDFAEPLGEVLAELELEMANMEFDKALSICEALLAEYSQ